MVCRYGAISALNSTTCHCCCYSSSSSRPTRERRGDWMGGEGSEPGEPAGTMSHTKNELHKKGEPHEEISTCIHNCGGRAGAGDTGECPADERFARWPTEFQKRCYPRRARARR